MDITQILITAFAVIGIVVVAALAILPPLIEAESWNTAADRDGTARPTPGPTTRPTARPAAGRGGRFGPLVPAEGAAVGPVR